MAKKSLGAKAAVFPQPVLLAATYNEDGTVDVMNIAVSVTRLQQISRQSRLSQSELLM